MTSHLVIDTREQRPYLFDGYDCSRHFDALPWGDYSLAGYERVVAVERKSLGDYLRSIGCERERFFGEVLALEAYRFTLVVVESSWDVLSGDNVKAARSRGRSKLSVNQIMGSTVKLFALGVPVVPVGTRSAGEDFVYRYLSQCHRELTGTATTGLHNRYDVELCRLYARCSLCGLERYQALRDRPDLGPREWVRVATRVEGGVEVLGDRVSVCYACRRKIVAKEARLPVGYVWAK